jgi:hypothetical protein
MGGACLSPMQQQAMACGSSGQACQVCTGGFVACQLGMTGGTCVVLDGGM